MKHVKHWKWVLISVGAVILVGGAGFAAYAHFTKPVIPLLIQREAGFVLFYPNGDPSITVNRSTLKYDKSLGQFSFVATFSGTKMTFGEQATPENFYTNASYYNNLITKMGGYYTFQNVDGTVNLTQISQLGHQVGVMNEKGTLLFIEGDSNLTKNNWREIFSSLSYTQSK